MPRNTATRTLKTFSSARRARTATRRLWTQPTHRRRSHHDRRADFPALAFLEEPPAVADPAVEAAQVFHRPRCGRLVPVLFLRAAIFHRAGQARRGHTG